MGHDFQAFAHANCIDPLSIKWHPGSAGARRQPHDRIVATNQHLAPEILPHQHFPMTIIEQLRTVADTPDLDSYVTTLAKHHLESVEHLTRFFSTPDMPVALVGQKGVGKSSLLSVLSGMVIGPPPRTFDEQKDRSVLPVGAGETSVCELRVGATLPNGYTPPPDANYGVILEPMSDDKIEREIEIFAEIAIKQRELEQRNQQGHVASEQENDSNGADTPDLLQPTEVKRAIRGLTGTTPIIRRDRGKFLPPIDPLRQLVEDSNSNRDRLADVLRERVGLGARNKTEWWFTGNREHSLSEIKTLLSRLNSGEEPNATLPRRITLWQRPEHIADSATPTPTFIDTLGFDGGLKGRGDLQSAIKDERTIILLCLRFVDHANEVMRGLLRDASSLPFLNISPERVRMVIIDWDQSRHTAGANGDREMGQWIKKTACEQSLAQHGLAGFAQEQANGDTDSILVFDPTRDDISTLSHFIASTGRHLLNTKRQMLEQATASATEFLNGIDDGVRTTLTMEVDRSIQQVFLAARPRTPFLPRGIAGLIELVKTNHVQRVAAMCRRAGDYDAMNAYDAMYASVEQMFHDHCESLDRTMHEHFVRLDANPRYAPVTGHINEKRETFNRRLSVLGTTIAMAVRKAVHQQMRPDPVWMRASHRWGQGSGYKDDINGFFRQWSNDHEVGQPYNKTFQLADFGLTELPD